MAKTTETGMQHSYSFCTAALTGIILFGLGCGTGYTPDEATVDAQVITASLPDTTSALVTRRIAVTFDDLPSTTRRGLACDADAVLSINTRLLAELERFEAPAAGFVNEGHGCRESDVLEQVLRQWLDAGHTLGNHTYAHTDINTVSLDAYIADIERGEPVTRRLLEEHGQALRYFRHPLLHAGADSAKWHGLRSYLAANGYEVAPVTIDNQEWVFEAVYRRAKLRGDTATMQRVAAAYVPHLAAVVEHFEHASKLIIGYEPPQVLLLHANYINADYFGDVAAMLRDRGYTFITLDEALRDPAYRLADGYIGRRGLSWVHRWARGKGMEATPEEPREPQWVRTLFETY